MSETNHTPFREAIMRAWVCGWYAGRMGETSDDGKRVAAECIARDFPAEDSASSLRADLAAERERVRVLREALEQFAECDLHDGNCAGLDVASRRIRNIARAALKSIAATEPTP